MKSVDHIATMTEPQANKCSFGKGSQKAFVESFITEILNESSRLSADTIATLEVSNRCVRDDPRASYAITIGFVF